MFFSLGMDDPAPTATKRVTEQNRKLLRFKAFYALSDLHKNK